MDPILLIVIILAILLLVGFGHPVSRAHVQGPVGIIVLVLVIILIVYLVQRL